MYVPEVEGAGVAAGIEGETAEEEEEEGPPAAAGATTMAFRLEGAV